MTRMTRTTLLGISLAGLFLAFGTAGCVDPKDQKIKDLTAENERLRGDVDAKDRELNDALTRDNDARETIDQLNRALAQARLEANKPGAEGAWISGTNFDFMSLPENVLFESGKAALTADGRRKLALVASDIRSRFGDRDVYVFGHTDAQPIRKSKWRDNWELSAQRSLTVVRTLHEMGVPYDQLISASCGEHRPIVADKAKLDQPKNRRVEFFAVKRGATGLSKVESEN